MKEIKLTNTVDRAIVDDEDYDRVIQFKWLLNRTRTSKVIKMNASPHLSLGAFILNLKRGSHILADHKNRNIFDNTKSNLRFATKSQNNMNQEKYSNNESGYKGVYWDRSRNKWKADIRVNRITKHLGGFKTKEEAALAYNKAALSYFGEFAVLNEIKLSA